MRITEVVHPVFRLINLAIAAHYGTSMSARFVVIYYQLNEIPIISE